jgi:hypothetical protein
MKSGEISFFEFRKSNQGIFISKYYNYMAYGPIKIIEVAIFKINDTHGP